MMHSELSCGCLLCCMQGLTFPLLENANEYIVHGFAYDDYLNEVKPPTNIGRVGASLDKAFASECGRAHSQCHVMLCTQPGQGSQAAVCCRCCMCVCRHDRVKQRVRPCVCACWVS